MSLQYICIEIRSGLHCANVFLQLSNLTETEFLKINVSDNELRLREYSTETRVDLSKFFTIEARTISNLIVEECNASFRLTIDNGQIATVPINAKDDQKFILPMPALHEGEDASVHCSNCKCSLTKGQQTFTRVRELPSSLIDVSEFFCHHGPDFQDVLVPRTPDIFYGFQFIVLNKSVAEQTITEKDTHLYCRRCLQYLGEALYAGKALKLWTDTILFKKTDDTDGYSEVYGNNTSTNTWALLQNILRAATVNNEDAVHQMNLSRIVIKATFPNRQSKYLLLQVLERHLEVLRNISTLSYGSHNNNNVMQVELEASKAIKVIFRLIDNSDRSDAVPPLLAYWQQDFAVQTTTISPTLFSHLMQKLDENALLIPEKYRNTHDSFQLSYLFPK